ncbi:ribbon-helix-helix domain-containing protein [Laspinema palackyanum]|uniref:ribbon-helix-helix domain-containing protein n=1 Tax=Laspinema palackyanum TaxID=3231601 RepID=UPI00345D3274|nr:ribbon-helix-helix domain-containing protein [Laspinema sp. D2c]
MSRPSKKAEAKSSKSGRAQVNVRTTPQLLAQIDQARQDRSRSEFIVQAIEAYLGIEPPSPQTTASLQSLVDAAVAQAIHSVTRTLEERLKALEIRLSSRNVDKNVDAPLDGGDGEVDSVAPVDVDLPVDSPVDLVDAPVDEVARVGVDAPVDAPVDSGDDALDDAVNGEELATSGDSGLAEVTGGDRNGSPESEDGVEAAGDSGDDAVEGEVQATSGELGLEEVAGGDRHASPESELGVEAAGDSVDGEELATSGELGLEKATVRDRSRSPESELGVDQSLDFTTQGLSGRELASRLSVSPSSITTNRKKKGTNAFAKWTSQQDPEAIAWSYQKERYYPVESKG